MGNDHGKGTAGLMDRPYVLLSLTMLFWAGNLVLARFVADQIPGALLAWLRWAGASLIVLPFTWARVRADWPMIRRHPVVLTILALSGITAYNTLSYWGLHFTQAINALLLQSFAPLAIALWTLILFRERLTLRQLIGIAVSLFGVVVIVCRGDLAQITHLTFNPGDLLLLTALVCYGLYSALLRRAPPIHPWSLLTVVFVWGALLLTPVVIVEYWAGARPHFTPSSVAVLGYVAVFPSIIAYLFFNRGVALIGANRAGPFLHLIPLFGAAIAILFLGEQALPFHGVGFALILAGVVIATRRPN
jgi:drug/metabolite transporter (DMT)-like permease